MSYNCVLREALSYWCLLGLCVSIKSHSSETKGAPQSSLQGCAQTGLVLVRL